MVWESGTQIFGNRYAIVKPIKKGGFGITYLVKDPKGRQFVLKTLKDEVMTEAEYIPFRDKFLRDFDRETAKIAICRHRHIVEVVNHFTHEGLPCMVMEYIQGQDLADRVARGGALSEAVALRYIREVGAALMVMHEKGLLHRDINPRNIMVRLPADEAVLIDFGIAREFIPNLTQTHTVALTPCFAPIEQYDKQEHRGEFTDVYALAATLYYLLTGVLPPIATMRVRRDRLEIPKHWSVELQNAIQQGMAVEPDDRPQTVAAWLALLPRERTDAAQSQLKPPGNHLLFPKEKSSSVQNWSSLGTSRLPSFASETPSPLMPGTYINQRYEVKKLFAQGGFSCVYLAEDLNHFKELCIITEYGPFQHSDSVMSKVRERLTQSIETIYQIKHPQIAEIDNVFEEGARLFFVQQHIEGQTLGDLRRSSNHQYTEREVRRWLEQLLPVFGYIHKQGIIHSDIKPDTIILRETDKLPILELNNFGMITQLGMSFTQPDSAGGISLTLGYAPREQLTGKTYPSSDLYSLALTMLELLTGRNSSDFYDQTNFTCRWREYVKTSNRFAAVLNRMLSDQVDQRYPSADAVSKALLKV